MIGRLVVGLGVGIASLVVPVYLSEICPVEVRGTVVAVDVMIITAGQFISSIIAFCLGDKWRIMLGLAGVPSLLQLISMVFMPESQRWLENNEYSTKCREVLKQVYQPEVVPRIHKELSDEIESMKQENDLPYCTRLKQLFTQYRQCLIVGCGLQFF